MLSQYFRFNARSAEPQRSELLERLLSRAAQCVNVMDWRAAAFRAIGAAGSQPPAPAAAALFADCGAVAGGWLSLATPVHYIADMRSVQMSGDRLAMSHGDAELLARDFNPIWHDAGIRMLAGRSGRLYCVFDEPLHLISADPEDVQTLAIESHLPAGADAQRVRRLMSEIEMWLFEHAVNRGRAAAALPAISGLWLWGGGAPLQALPPVHGFIEGDDVLFGALAAPAAEASTPGAPPSAAASSGVVVTREAPGTPAWRRIESRRLESAAAQLRAGGICSLQLSAGDRCYTVTPRSLRRFWRRPKPWWQAFQ